MKRSLCLLAAPAAFALSLSACNVATNGAPASFPPSGRIVVSIAGSGTLTTSAAAPFVLRAGSAQTVTVSEDAYTGVYTATSTSSCVTASATNGAGAGIAPFVIAAAVSSATCTYPQTATVTFADAWGNTAAVYVQAQ